MERSDEKLGEKVCGWSVGKDAKMRKDEKEKI